MKLNFLFLLLGLVLCSYACKKEGTIEFIYGCSYDEVSKKAIKQKEPYCIVLIDSTDNKDNKYISLLGNYLKTSRNIICNIIDVNTVEGQWLFKSLSPQILPTTCVFNQESSFVDIIPGSAKESLLYTQLAIDEETTTNFHLPNRFNLQKSKLIPLIEIVLATKVNLEYGIYDNTSLDKCINLLDYPYPLYLKMIGMQIEKDSVEMRSIANMICNNISDFDLEIFKEEYITAKKILNPYFETEDEANIEIVEGGLNNIEGYVGENIPFEVQVRNIGMKPLKISNIKTSCDCVWYIGNRNITIQPHEKTILKFIFHGERENEYVRDIFITSNAINIPFLNIKVSVNLKNNAI